MHIVYTDLYLYLLLYVEDQEVTLSPIPWVFFQFLSAHILIPLSGSGNVALIILNIIIS